jgi:hypothetical protein
MGETSRAVTDVEDLADGKAADLLDQAGVRATAPHAFAASVPLVPGLLAEPLGEVLVVLVVVVRHQNVCSGPGNVPALTSSA